MRVKFVTDPALVDGWNLRIEAFGRWFDLWARRWCALPRLTVTVTDPESS